MTSRELLKFAEERVQIRKDADGDDVVVQLIPDQALSTLFHEIAVLASIEVQTITFEEDRALNQPLSSRN